MRRPDLLPHLDPLRRYARVLVRAEDQAEDLVQGALLKAWEARAGIREGAGLRTWLMAILHNLWIDQQRRQRSAAARETAWAELNPGFATPDGEQALRLAQLRAAVLRLPDGQRQALHLVAVEGLSIAEAAAVLDVPAGTVMSRLGRARAALRRFEATGQPPPRLSVVGGRDVRD